jgi:hypothetical protein
MSNIIAKVISGLSVLMVMLAMVNPMAIKTLTKEIVRNIHSSLSRPANVLV